MFATPSFGWPLSKQEWHIVMMEDNLSACTHKATHATAATEWRRCKMNQATWCDGSIHAPQMHEMENVIQYEDLFPWATVFVVTKVWGCHSTISCPREVLRVMAHEQMRERLFTATATTTTTASTVVAVATPFHRGDCCQQNMIVYTTHLRKVSSAPC